MRRIDDSKKSRVVELYNAGGLSVHAVAKETRTGTRYVRKWVTDAGKMRHYTADLDAGEIRRRRRKDKMHWRQIADEMKVGTDTVRRAYRRAYRDDGAIRPFSRLTAGQERELRATWEAIPAYSTGRRSGDRAVTTSPEGHDFCDLVARYNDAGVRYREMAGVVVSDPSYLSRLANSSRRRKARKAKKP